MLKNKNHSLVVNKLQLVGLIVSKKIVYIFFLNVKKEEEELRSRDHV